ncbi:MAG: glycosyltransferase family 2 protein [Oscillospiraceae bacterium]|nr:glycosyltransferase family 2 protein [Oscillospiraceae bacterium]
MDRILLFIPMYNCEKQIPRVLAQLRGGAAAYITAAIVVNNRSTDGSEQAVVDYLNDNAPRVPVTLLRNDDNYNLGGSHKVAFQYALDNGFDYVVVFHGDDQGRLDDFLPLFQSGEYKKYDAVLGSRFMKGSQTPGYSAGRKLGNYVFNALFSVMTLRRVRDIGSGLNLYRAAVFADGVHLRFYDDLIFNCHSLLYLYDQKRRVRFYPISWREEDQISNAAPFKQARQIFRMLLTYVFTRRTLFTKDYRAKPVAAYTSAQIYPEKAHGVECHEG